MTSTHRAPSVLDDPEGHLSVVDFTSHFPTVFERAGQSRDVTPLYAEKFPHRYLLRTGDHAIVDELCDGTRFVKNVSLALGHFRPLAGDGMATGYNDEPNRRTARELLAPAFAMNAVRAYHPSMLTAATRMLRSWDRAAADGRPVPVPTDTTRLTLDAIGLAGCGYDFDSFSRAERHPFATAMLSSLRYLQHKIFDPDSGDTARFETERDLQFRLVDRIIADRRAGGDPSASDPLGLLLNAPEGLRLPDESIRNQLLTLLIAGHETTSAALTFALYQLARNPAALHLAQAETDALWGDEPDPQPAYADVAALRYVRQCLNESLRLWPPAITFAREARHDTTLAGRYPLRAGDAVLVNIPMLHRDPVWGDNVECFDPDRFASGAVAGRPAGTFMPFGTGERACVGRQFSTHEAVMVLGMVVHRYRLVADPRYRLRISQAMTIKPDGFELTLVRRTPADRAANGAALSVLVRRPAAGRPPAPAGRPARGARLTVAHGSDLGTTAEYAARLAGAAEELGITTRHVTLNELTGDLGTDPLLVVAASYNGRPTADAADFVAWLTKAPGARVPPFTVLGNGDRGWAATYQHVPALIDRRLGELGGRRTAERGEVDQSADPTGMLLDFTERYRRVLIEMSGDAGAPAPSGAKTAPAPEFRVMTVTETRDLAQHGRPKRFVRLRLPPDVDYRTADHLAVLPENDPATVRATARVLGIPAGHLAGREPAGRLTAEQLARVAGAARCPRDASRIRALEPDVHTLAGLVERFPALRDGLTWPAARDLLPPLRPRTYSISSSPGNSRRHVDLMVSLTPGGVGSGHLHRLRPDDTVLARVVPCRETFRVDHTVPAIMVCAGTGLAPFRGAIADRSRLRPEQPALCYFGCAGRDLDYLHRAELEAADAARAVSMRPTFSLHPENGHRYVQHRIAAEAEEVWTLLENGGRVYVCGDGEGMAPGVRAAFADLCHRFTGEDGEIRLQRLMEEGRYVEDVYAGPG
ncbi:cytochrome P450 [Streptomyces daghestanicus]|uniref:NADPH--hemoprotein reductase n=1 Tax=Streptomyces daghestanicus TaxID=66885 RepID=A0ABQ3QB79_9ACTN|nr:cytochrome P450 [Streptomyces daghestanicus]GGU44612.1 bifunctional cytochrome P450/NADPH--P450 reductase 2 [Streptomyces daghestanicus]GHI34543.1 bifunctional cytochrome P450/NADPH--P450 reductase 2 [Streptomyces daghestanicus]